MQNAEALTDKQISEFLKGSAVVEFTGQTRSEIYGWTEDILVAQEYARQGKRGRGAVRAYLSKTRGLSLPQITRLIRSYTQTGRVEVKPSWRRRFPGKYTERDVALLAEVDRAHERLSGPATRHILGRESAEFGKPEFVGLAGISVSHLYNLRQRLSYRKAADFTVTRPSGVSIGCSPRRFEVSDSN